MGALKSVGYRTGSHTVNPASFQRPARWPKRISRELLTTGELARKRTARPARTPPGQSGEPLTAQETQVNRLAIDGLLDLKIGTGCPSVSADSELPYLK